AFGLVMAEAMACYTPVIATATDGAAEQIRHGDNGYILKQHDSEQQIVSEFTQAIAHVLALAEADYYAMQHGARQQAEQYLLAHIAEQLQQLYQELANE
ncbi:MAG: glycosyltransferase, partial [Gammaproteobacteria bacterium]|nr:glycosyltransferase [Gammaproteobacteria bacterium]